MERGREGDKWTVTQPFRDPESQSETSPTFPSQTIQSSSGQQVRLQQKGALTSPLANSKTFDTPQCPPTSTLTRVVDK